MPPYLTLPSTEYKTSYLEALREFRAEGRYLDEDMRYIENRFDDYVRGMLARATAEPPEGRVKETIFWLVDEQGFIGRISVRHELNLFLRNFGGHIGYEISPTRRREGNGKLALQLMLPEAKKIGLDKVMLTCDETNIGSRRIIESCGGVLEDIIQNDFMNVPTMRWWIDLADKP